jgi:hypothetical protein
VLDLPALEERLGFDHSTMHDDLPPKLKCSKCGSKGRKKLGLTLSYKGSGLHDRVEQLAD